MSSCGGLHIYIFLPFFLGLESAYIGELEVSIVVFDITACNRTVSNIEKGNWLFAFLSVQHFKNISARYHSMLLYLPYQIVSGLIISSKKNLWSSY